MTNDQLDPRGFHSRVAQQANAVVALTIDGEMDAVFSIGKDAEADGTGPELLAATCCAWKGGVPERDLFHLGLACRKLAGGFAMVRAAADVRRADKRKGAGDE